MRPPPTQHAHTHTHAHTHPNTQTHAQDNLKRIPKASALWFSKNFWEVSGRFGPDFYRGLFPLKGADAKAAKAALVNRL